MFVSPHMFLVVAGAILVTGILLCRISTFFVVNRVEAEGFRFLLLMST